MHATEIGTAAIKSDGIQSASKPLQKSASETPATEPETFGQKWQSAMNVTSKSGQTEGLENPMGSKTASTASPVRVAMESSAGAGDPASSEIKAATCVRMQEVAPDNTEVSTGDTEAAAQNKAAFAAPVVTFADGPNPNADTQSIKQTNLPAVPAGHVWKEKRETKRAASASRPYAEVDNNSQVRDAATAESLRPDGTAGKLVAASASDLSDGCVARGDMSQAPANLTFASHTNQSSAEAEPRKGGKARVMPSPVVCATASLTGLPATISVVGQWTNHSAQSGGISSIAEAKHVAVNSVTAAEGSIFHTPTQAARPLTNFVSPPLIMPSALVNHATSAHGAAMSDQWLVASGPMHLDVGVFDGTHGWLRVRAELNPAGAVYASLTANASAHVSLKSALPEMANYLISEAVGVSKIAVHRFDAPNGAATGQSGGNAAGFGSSNQREQDSGPHKQRLVETGNSDQQGETTKHGVLWPAGFSSGMGGWLNVCA